MFNPSARFACLVTLVAATAATAAVGSAGAASVGCGDVLTTNVALTADLTCPSGVGLFVSDGVTVDFAGHTLSGAGTGALGVVIGHGAAQLRNGRIQGFHGEGVSTSLATVTLDKMQITGNGAGVVNFPGVVTIQSSSISDNAGAALCCSFFRVRDSSLLRNGGGISGAQGLDMSGSTVSGNGGARTILSLNDNAVTLIGNEFRNTDVSIFTTIDQITITGNRFVNGGLDITDGNAITLSDNVFLGNNGPLGGHTISVSPNSGYPTVTVGRNRLINQTLVVTDPLVKVLDLGGNTGNRCGTLLDCHS